MQVTSSKSDPQRLGASAHEFSDLHLPLVSSAVGAASKLADRRKQMALLATTKRVATSALALVGAAKGASGDCSNKAAVSKVDDAATQFQLDCAELTRQLETATGDAGALSAIAANVQRSMQNMGSTDDAQPDGTYLQYNAALVATAKKLALTAPDVLSVQASSVVTTLRDIASIYNAMVGDARMLTVLSNNHETNGVLSSSVQELGASLVGLVQACKAVQANGEDVDTRRALSSTMQQVSGNVATLFAALQLGVKGIRACEAAMQVCAHSLRRLSS